MRPANHAMNRTAKPSVLLKPVLLNESMKESGAPVIAIVGQ
jgi:hypothetical protein